MDRDANDEKNVAATVSFRSYDINRTWPIVNATMNMIQKGFDEQAKAIAFWLAEDKANAGSLGTDYIDEYYPGLSRTVNSLTGNETRAEVESALSQKMMALFNESFKVESSLFVPKANNLTSDEKMTLNGLLVNNCYQPQFNYAIRFYNRKVPYSGPLFDPDYAWNRGFAPEPVYEQAMKRAAGAHAPGDLRDRKKQRISGDGL